MANANKISTQDIDFSASTSWNAAFFLRGDGVWAAVPAGTVGDTEVVVGGPGNTLTSSPDLTYDGVNLNIGVAGAAGAVLFSVDASFVSTGIGAEINNYGFWGVGGPATGGSLMTLYGAGGTVINALIPGGNPLFNLNYSGTDTAYFFLYDAGAITHAFQTGAAKSFIDNVEGFAVGSTGGAGMFAVRGATNVAADLTTSMRNSDEVLTFTLNNAGGIAMPLVQVGDAGLAAGDIYFDTAANILANGDLIAARIV